MEKDKNEFETQNGFQSGIGALKGQKLKIFDSFQLKSLCGHQTPFLCASSQCNQDAAICNSFCKDCRKRHSKCVDAKIINAICENIDQSIIELDSEDKSFLKQIQQKADQIVDNVSSMTSSLARQIKLLGVNQCDRDLTYCLLKRLDSKTTKDEEIIEIIEESETFSYCNEKFDGNTIKQLFEQTKFSQKNWFNESIQRLKLMLEKSKQMITYYFDEIQDCLLNLHTKHHQVLDSECYFSSSKILKTEQLETFWKDNFGKHLEKAGINGLPMKKIFTYRSSVDKKLNFLDDQFINTLQGEKDLLFLVQNNYHKRFGFFTPLQFDLQDNHWKSDKNLKPMIFSLDSNRNEFIRNAQYLMKFDPQNRKINLGRIYEKQKSNDEMKCGIQIVMNQLPSCEINMNEERITQTNWPFMIPNVDLLGNSQPQQNQQIQKQSQFKVINGFQKVSSVSNPTQLIKLQVYKVQRPIKPQLTMVN